MTENNILFSSKKKIVLGIYGVFVILLRIFNNDDLFFINKSENKMTIYSFCVCIDVTRSLMCSTCSQTRVPNSVFHNGGIIFFGTLRKGKIYFAQSQAQTRSTALYQYYQYIQYAQSLVNRLLVKCIWTKCQLRENNVFSFIL